MEALIINTDCTVDKKSKPTKLNKAIESTYSYDLAEHLISSEGNVLGFASFTK